MDKYLKILKEYWGYDSFRSIQADIIQSIGEGRDTLGLMPTGGGKSITFQVPAMSMEGVCLVITPLIALMQDQVNGLLRRGIRAAAIYSGMSYNEMNILLDNAIYGHCKFLYVAPERLSSESFRIKLRQMDVSLLVIDEAHCISQWGYDFRPAYLKITDIFEDLYPERPPILALTATATPKVVEDIMTRLEFRSPNSMTASFVRPNLAYIVRDTQNKVGEAIGMLRRTTGSAIVYVGKRASTTEYANIINSQGISALPYHAGMNAKQKKDYQEQWTKGNVRVMVCTNAFGMGIDKPNVRLVIHMDVPGSLEAYFQEAGRAGRDGNTAYAVLLNAPRDISILEQKVNNAFPPKEKILEVYNAIGNTMVIGVGSGEGVLQELNLGLLCKNYHLSTLQVHYSLQILKNAGYLEYEADADFPPRVMFLMDGEPLYNLRQNNPDLNIIIETLLRKYEGLYTKYIQIDEYLIAKICNITHQQLYERMLKLSRMDVLLYNPAKHMSYVYWLQDRVSDKYLYLPKEVYADREADQRSRVSSVRQYLENNSECRTLQLVRYFGQTAAEPCGMCDVCRAQNSNKDNALLTKEQFQSLCSQIIERVQASPNITITALKDALDPNLIQNNEDNIMQALRYLQDWCIGQFAGFF
ncbi:MAG: ATP-dependent DNA helicase RecQ [Bacteroidia bacterium]|nr:ATP-dependent DNA helicase RecQ [Bacteroidia bacterium]